MDPHATDLPSTSKTAALSHHPSQSQTLAKTVSSPTSLNLHLRPPTPSLATAGKQGSINFRHSQLYDSGAEGSDADDQTRLIRSPSIRSHKFIIIPATSPGLGQQAKYPSNTSTSSLTALQKLPLRSPTNPSLAGTPTSPSPALGARQQQSPFLMAKIPATQLSSRSDVTHQPFYMMPSSTSANRGTAASAAAMTTATPSSSVNANVKFTIEDYESDNATDAPNTTTPSPPAIRHRGETTSSTLDALYSFQMPAISSIYSGNNSTTSSSLHHHQQQQHHPLTTFSPPLPPYPLASSASASARLSPASPSSLAPPALHAGRPVSALLGAGGNSTCTSAGTLSSSLGIGLRPRNDRNSSMRSVVSAYLTDPNDLTINSYLQNQDDSNSYLFRDSAAHQIFSDVTSVRSLASIGIGSTDGRKIVIKRVPQTPTDLLNIVNPPTPQLPGVDDEDDDSYMDMSDDVNNLKPRQQHWGSKMQFVLACIGYSVGLGNVWRFPYMCYKSGGGVFLVPYCIILIICSIPLLFMELSVGQYTGRGPIGALGQLCPLFKGAGLASVVVSFLMSTYYSVIIGYSIYYFFTAFKTDMPWVDCNNRWNTPDCWEPQRDNSTSPPMSRTPSEEFFENKVLQISPGIEYPGQMRWELFACLICAWLMVYFATWKSIKSSAKVRYFTATFPFILIIILMGRAVTLEGADDGLRYFFRPNWSELKHANVWINAASQNFNSLGITFGSMISFASYNKYNNNILRDTIAVSVVNVLTSLLVGVFAFATLGNLALEQNTHVKNVIGDGPGLIFVVYPQAMAKMPYAQLWAVMFFFMLLCLGLNSQFAIVEVVVTSIQDGFPNWIKKHLGYHEIVVLIVCVISFLFGLPNLIQGGIYFFQLMDHYAASVTIMILAFCQMIAVAWFYGTGRLSKNIKQMTGKAPSFYLKSCWLIFGPCLLFAIWILSLINYREPTYHNGRYTYPDWAYGIGWMFASLSLVCIPGYAIVNLIKAQGHGLRERFQSALRPNIYECKICGEHHCEHDYPEQEQFMLSQEMGGIYRPTTTKAPIFPVGSGQKSGYNPMHLQEKDKENEKVIANHDEGQYTTKEENVKPSTSTSTTTKGADSQTR